MARKFKLIPDAQIAEYATPLRLAQDQFNAKVRTYNQYETDAERARALAEIVRPDIILWQTAIKALKRFS